MDKYKVVNGTFYSVKTSDKIISILENCRMSNKRIILDYGNVETGESWGEIHDITGRVSRSAGRIKIPILIHNARSTGGGAILDHCIIGIKESRGGKVLYSNK